MSDSGRFTNRERIALAGLLDHLAPPWRADRMPPLGHWLCFPPIARQSLLGPDGHPVRAEHPDLPRRMWAGSRVAFLADVPVGATLHRTSSIIAETEKQGRTGRMVFVTLRHEIACDGTLAIVEEQDVVYRAMPAPAHPGTPAESPVQPPLEPQPYRGGDATLMPDPAMLFRFSALTYNAHRIHYDLPYARGVEGYRGLVVHGPLIATLLMDRLLRKRPGAAVTHFTFRAVAPLFAGEQIAFTVDYEDDVAILQALGPAGIGMTAKALFSR